MAPPTDGPEWPAGQVKVSYGAAVPPYTVIL
jgi:hypothetical protein